MIKITSRRMYISTSIRNVPGASLSGSGVYDRVLDDWFGRNIGNSISFGLFLVHILLSWRHFFAKCKSFGWGQDMARLNLSQPLNLSPLNLLTSQPLSCLTVALGVFVAGIFNQVWGKVQNIFKPNTCTGNIKAKLFSAAGGMERFCNVANWQY